MSCVAQLAHLPGVVPPHLVTATVLFLIATATLVIGLVRQGHAFVRRLPSILFLWAGTTAFWFLSFHRTRPWTVIPTMIAGVALLVEMILAHGERVDPKDLDLGSSRLARRYLIATLTVVAAMLFYHLGTYSGALLTWEAPVVAGYPNVGGFVDAYKSGQTVLEYTLQRFLWDEGLLSAGHTSLFYGAPTYALFHLIGFSAWSLRVMAVVATLLSVALIFVLGRRFFGTVVSGAAAVAFGLNSCVLFYGRYGSSPAGTLLAVLLAVWCTWRFLDAARPAWWTGPACAAALYLATLQYSPARLVVLFLLAFLTAVLTWRWRRLHWQQAVGFAVVVAAAAGVWRMQCDYGTEQTFLMARGEQYFDLIKNPEYVNELFDKDLLGRPLTAATITPADKIELLYRIIQTTTPQYADLMRPRIETQPLTDITRLGALPQLYYAPFVLFIAWGITHSLLRMRAWPHACLLLWVAITTVPLLLTNRVDSHRIMLFVIPLSLWAALGVWEAARVLAQAQVPIDVRHFFALLLALTVAYNDVHLLHRDPRRDTAAEAIAAEAAHVPGRVAVGGPLDHREMGWLELAMLERTRRDRTQAGEVLDERLVRAARERSALTVHRLRTLINDTTVLLAPADHFRKVAAVLQTEGARVAERGQGKIRVLRLDAGAAATGVPDEIVQPLATIVLPPTPTPIPLAAGPQILLTTLKPLDVAFGFAPPKIDHSWNDTPMVMAGVPYESGIGMHAWCRMTFAVPSGATAFQAIVGLSDEVRDCPAADVGFEVHDQSDRLLFRSRIINATSAPQPIRVDLHDVTAITLVVTEGRNGRDCDHANWALPAFLMGTH
jgi:hypothetical protein